MIFILPFLALLMSSAGAVDPQPVHVGLIIPETRQDRSTANPWGVQQKQGFELALSDSKAVKYEIKDNSESAIFAREQAAYYVNAKVDLIAGLSFSDQAIAVKQLSEPAGIPYVTVFGTSENLFDKEKIVFSMAMPNDVQASRLVRFLSTLKDARKDGVDLIVARNCEYCVDMERSFKAEIAKSAIPVHALPDILKNRPVPHDYFEKIQPRKLLVVLAYEVEGLSVVNALAKRGYHGIIAGGDSWSTQTMQVAGNMGLLKDICLVNPVPYDIKSKTKENQGFVKAFKSRFGETPTDVAALAFDAGRAIEMAAHQCLNTKDKRDCLRDSLSKVHFQGASGNVHFTKNGKRLDPGLLLKSPACAEVEAKYGRH